MVKRDARNIYNREGKSEGFKKGEAAVGGEEGIAARLAPAQGPETRKRSV